MTLTQYLDKIGVDPNGDFLREGAMLMAQMAMDWEVRQQTAIFVIIALLLASARATRNE